jgi:hypothetical protein
VEGQFDVSTESLTFEQERERRKLGDGSERHNRLEGGVTET